MILTRPGEADGLCGDDRVARSLKQIINGLVLSNRRVLTRRIKETAFHMIVFSLVAFSFSALSDIIDFILGCLHVLYGSLFSVFLSCSCLFPFFKLMHFSTILQSPMICSV